MTGRPILSAAARACSALVKTPVPGRTGTPAAIMVSRAWTLSPIRRMWSGSGPMNTMLHFCTASANSARSAKNP